MIDEVVRALNARMWPEYVLGQLGPLVGDAVAPTLRLAVGGRRLPDQWAPIPVGASKVGGLPDVGAGFDWPTEDGTDTPLALVCQINLAEAAAAAAPGALPERGMLYLFSIHDSDRAYGYEIDEQTAKVVHVPDPGPLHRATRPAGLGDDGVLAERQLAIGPTLFCEEAHEDGGYDSARFDYTVESAIDEEATLLGGVAYDAVRLLGHPHPFRDESREQIGPTARLLLFVNGYTVARNAFGEGDFQVVIDPDDLTAGRLDRAEVVFEPGT